MSDAPEGFNSNRVVGMDRRPYSGSGKGPTLPTGGGGDNYDLMEARVRKLEDDMTSIQVTLGRIDERLIGMASNLATKADLADTERRVGDKVAGVETRVGVSEGELKRTLGVWQFLAIMIAAVGIIVKWPAISAALGI